MIDKIADRFHLDIESAEQYSPLSLAYVGDAIFEIVVRSMTLLEANRQVRKLHKESSEIVNAKSQAMMAHYLLENDMLSEEEIRVLKSGRNAKAFTKAKNASIVDYRNATGFEALMGYLYLKNDMDRLLFLIDSSISYLKENS